MSVNLSFRCRLSHIFFRADPRMKQPMNELLGSWKISTDLLKLVFPFILPMSIFQKTIAVVVLSESCKC